MTTEISVMDQLAEDVRRDDADRFYTVLLAPARYRDPLLVLYAFNLEIARTREQVSEPMLGQIRLQWWRDQLDGIFTGQPPRHPVAAALADIAADHGLDRTLLETMIDARERDLDDSPPDTTADLLAYCRGTSSSLMSAASRMLGVSDRVADAIAGPAGIAYALTGLIRAVPFHGAQGRVMLPRDVMETHGLDIAAGGHHRDPAALKAVIRDLVGMAEDQLVLARKAGRVPRHAMAAILPATLAGLYLKRLRAADYDLSDQRLDPAAHIRIFSLLRGRILGRI